MINGYEAWIDSQIDKSPSLHQTLMMTMLSEEGLTLNGTCEHRHESQRARADAWWENALHGKDQLRQRMAFALSEIIVISQKNDALFCQAKGMANFYDIFINKGFENYLDILQEITFHPAMGAYLSSLFNEKSRAEKNILPDEDFAREFMQLFTIGLHELNDDGSRIKNHIGDERATYSQEKITTFSKVFTGFHYGDTFSKIRTKESEVTDMRVFIAKHDNSEKYVFNGVILPAEGEPNYEIKSAIKNIFEHHNTAPFISRQLIQRFVTSNPSPGYILRVSNVFNNNGSGIKGDLKAVIKAVLLDKEAINGHRTLPHTFGKIKEPLLRLSGLLRAYNAKKEGERYRFTKTNSSFGQEVLSAHSVFNFFSSNYSPHGPLRDQGMVSPEFEILNSQTITTTTNDLRKYSIGTKLDYKNSNIELIDINDLAVLAIHPERLVEKLDMDLTAGSMSKGMKEILIDFIVKIDSNDLELRAKEALFLVITSPEYAVQR